MAGCAPVGYFLLVGRGSEVDFFFVFPRPVSFRPNWWLLFSALLHLPIGPVTRATKPVRAFPRGSQKPPHDPQFFPVVGSPLLSHWHKRATALDAIAFCCRPRPSGTRSCPPLSFTLFFSPWCAVDVTFRAVLSRALCPFPSFCLCFRPQGSRY